MKDYDFSNNLEDKDNPMCISVKFTEHSKAVPLLESQENKAKFVRCLLEDFATVNGIPESYVSMTEKERLEKYFRVNPPRQEIRQAIQAGITKMEENKKLLAYVVRYVALWKKFSPIFLPDCAFICFIAQFVLPNSKKAMENGIPEDDLGYTFISDIKTFGEWCHNNAFTPNGMAQLESREKAIGQAERMFVQLTYQWFCLSDSLNNASGYSTEKVTDLVLEFIKSYVDHDYCNDMFLAPLFTNFVESKLKATPVSAPAPASPPAA